MNEYTLPILVSFEKILIRWIPRIVILSLVILLGMMTWKLNMINQNQQTWTINIVKPGESNIGSYVSYSEPIVEQNRVQWTSADGTTQEMQYNPGTAIIIKEVCKEEEDVRTGDQ